MLKGEKKGIVYLVSGGPGDPGLLTLRAVECLERADMVIYDQLIHPRQLDYSPQSEKICVGDLPGPHSERHSHVYQLMIHAAASGKVVTRLKGGDWGVFGRGGEEAATLREAGIRYEIVPGVTAALAAGAFTGIPLTHRTHSSAVAFVTGHECPGKQGAALDWAALARFPGTLVIYMGVARLESITKRLIDNGMAPQTPAATVQWASLGSQMVVSGRLDAIAKTVSENGISAPAVTIIGPAAELRETLDWVEDRPLFGKGILVTRPREQAGPMIRMLESLGAVVYSMPVIEIGPPPVVNDVDKAIENLQKYDWIVFTSANGVRCFLERIIQCGKDVRAIGHARLAAIGPRTAIALNDYHLIPDLVPSEFRSEALAEELCNRVQGQRVLLARANRGREILRVELKKVAEVDEIAVYSQIDIGEADTKVLNLLRVGRIQYVTLTSSFIARAFIRLIDGEIRGRIGNGIDLVTISPVTSEAVSALGYPVAIEAQEYTSQGMIEALCGS